MTIRRRQDEKSLCSFGAEKNNISARFRDLFPVLFQREIKEIVIFCEDIDVQVIADLYKTQRIRGFRAVVIKMPILWRDEWWGDLALASGGTVIDIGIRDKVDRNRNGAT